MGKVKNTVDRMVEDVRTDYTWNRVIDLSKEGARRLPTGTAHYLVDKVPVVGWLPRYNPKWLINDFIAGLTLGLMLIPQSLSYAKIATIPVEYGLMSSWLPATLYVFMGSTKDLSTGPTSLIGLMTSDVVSALSPEGYTPQQIASAVAMVMGILGLILGFLNLGFLLEFISQPVLSGFISAVAITIGLNQMESLLGEDNVGDGAAHQIHDVLHQLPNANGYACAIGFTGIFFITALEQAGKRWGNGKSFFSRTVWLFTILRAFLCLLIFTGVSYGVNKKYGKDDDSYLFDVVKVKASGIAYPEVPDSTLISKAFPRSITAFVGGALEHVAIARSFGVKNNYVADQTQELAYFGVTNFVNSFFHTMGVGGAMSRTSVNSMCRVRSPLSGLVTTAVVLICIFKLSGALYWVPKATLAAIIICAVAPLVAHPRVFYGYWKTSLADFIASQIAFWVCLFVNTYTGLAAAVGFNIVYYLLRQVFVRVRQTGSDDRSGLSELQRSISSASGLPGVIPDDVRIFRFEESIFFPNAYRIKMSILDAVETHHSPAYSSRHGAEAERNWSVQAERHVRRLRKKAGITDPSGLPPISIVVLDFSRVSFFDVTAMNYVKQFIKEVQLYGGQGVEVRFASLSEHVRIRLERAGYHLYDWDIAGDDEVFQKNSLHIYGNVAQAVLMPKQYDPEDDLDVEKKGEAVETIEKVKTQEV